MKTIEEMWELCSSTLARRHLKVSGGISEIYHLLLISKTLPTDLISMVRHYCSSAIRFMLLFELFWMMLSVVHSKHNVLPHAPVG